MPTTIAPHWNACVAVSLSLCAWVSGCTGSPSTLGLQAIHANTEALLGSCSHRVTATLRIRDNTDGDDLVPPADATIAAAQVPVEVQLRDTGVFWTVGAGRTDDAGRLDVTLTGVKCDTSVRLRLSLKDDELRVYKPAGTIHIDIDEVIDVTADGPAAFAERTIEPCPSDFCEADHVAALAWVYATRHLAAAERLLGRSMRSLVGKRLEVKIDGSDSTADATPSRIRLGVDGGALSQQFRGATIAHEMGHWLAYGEASGHAAPDYGWSKPAGAYPEDRSPYVLTGKVDGHRLDTYEDAPTAATEGHAHFVAQMLLFDGHCRADQYETWNTDRDHRDANTAAALCDLVDEGVDQVTWRHAFLPSATASELAQHTPARDFNPDIFTSNASFAYGLSQDRRTLYAIDYASGASSVIGSTGLVSSLGASRTSNLCALSSGLHCYDAALGRLEPRALPAPGGGCHRKPLEVAVSDTKVFLLSANRCGSVTAVELHETSYAAAGWSLVMSSTPGVPLDETMQLSVNGTGTKLYFATERAVMRCETFACGATWTAVAGDPVLGGFARGATALFSRIRELQFANGDLYVADAYGISRIPDLGPVTVEQIVGAGGSQYLLNDLSYRSLRMNRNDQGKIFFATNGSRDLMQYTQRATDDNRMPLDARTVEVRARTALVRMGAALTQVTYCGIDAVSVAPAATMRAFAGLRMNAVRVHEVLGNALGVTSADRDSVERTSGVAPSSLGCQGGEDIELEHEAIAPIHNGGALDCGGLGDEQDDDASGDAPPT